MTFAAFLVLSLVQLTPVGPAQTNVALPFTNMELCDRYAKSIENEMMHASSLPLVNATTSCVPAEQLKGEQPKQEPKADPGKPA